MADTVYTPSPPSADLDGVKPPDPLTSEHEEMFKEVLAHFSKTAYFIPGFETEKGQLTEEEKFWLVSIL